MTESSPGQDREQRDRAFRMALLGVTGQVGCVTLLVIAAALAAGLWLDRQLNTRPMFTLVLVLGSIPITLLLMTRVALSAARTFKVRAGLAEPPNGEKESGSGHSAAD